MTQVASKRPRATPPPLPRSAASISGVRPIPQAASGKVAGPLKQVLLRVDVGEESLAGSSEDRRTLWDHQRPVEFVDDTHFVAGLSQEPHAGGVFVATYRRVAVGTKVHLGFEFPNGQLAEARGVVRWVREQDDSAGRPGLGVAFTEVSDSALVVLGDYCRSRPPLYFDF